MLTFNPRNLPIIVSALMVGIAAVHCSDNCALYDSLDWGNNDTNFEKISGFYSVVKSNHLSLFGDCEVHGLTQQANGDIEDNFVIHGSACTSVYKNRITKTSTAFQFAFYNNDTNCMPPPEYRATDNMKMKVAVDGSCFFKSFCLPDGTSVINLLCKKVDGLLSVLLNAVVNILLALLGSVSSSLSRVPQICYNQIISDPNQQALLLP